jgi:DNA (cytosine-5)-methyltransferase 1
VENKDLVLVDGFSGIGGFALAFMNAGFKINRHYFSEIDPHAIANYSYNFKNANPIGNIQFIHELQLERPDIFTFGSPCQDFSVSGEGKGLDGDKSSLIREAIRFITDKRPHLFVWENVKGAFSTNDGAYFWAIIQSFANIGGYRLEWQLLNTKWLLPQNRERIYLIGYLDGGKFSAGKVFPITKDDFLFDETQRKIKSAINCTTINRKMGSTKMDTYIQYDVNRKNQKSQQDRVYSPDGIMNCIPKSRTDSKIKIFSTMQRSGDPKKGGVGILYKDTDDNTFCIDCDNSQAIEIEDRMRKMTEIEVERVQGFPDDWTKYGDYNGKVKEIPMTRRYELLGNAVTSKLVEVIATKLKNSLQC